MPDASEHAADDPDVHQALSDWLGLEVRLMSPPADGLFPMEVYSDMSDEAIGTTIRDTNGNNLGVYASVTQSGTVRVGDGVHAG